MTLLPIKYLQTLSFNTILLHFNDFQKADSLISLFVPYKLLPMKRGATCVCRTSTIHHYRSYLSFFNCKLFYTGLIRFRVSEHYIFFACRGHSLSASIYQHEAVTYTTRLQIIHPGLFCSLLFKFIAHKRTYPPEY